MTKTVHRQSNPPLFSGVSSLHRHISEILLLTYFIVYPFLFIKAIMIVRIFVRNSVYAATHVSFPHEPLHSILFAILMERQPGGFFKFLPQMAL